MKKQLTFTLPLPPTLNHTYRIGSKTLYKTQEASLWEDEAGWIIKKSKVNPIEGPVKISIEMYLKYDRDIDSSQKLLMDTLQRMQVVKNDKQFESLNVTKQKDKENPRLKVIVTEID